MNFTLRSHGGFACLLPCDTKLSHTSPTTYPLGLLSQPHKHMLLVKSSPSLLLNTAWPTPLLQLSRKPPAHRCRDHLSSSVNDADPPSGWPCKPVQQPCRPAYGFPHTPLWRWSLRGLSILIRAKVNHQKLRDIAPSLYSMLPPVQLDATAATKAMEGRRSRPCP